MDKKLCEDKDFAEFMDFVEELAKENEQLKKAEKINMEYAEQIVEENKKLRIERNDLRRENEQLKKEHKIAIDEMITDYKNLEKENEELKEDKKILDSIKKRHNCSNCVKAIENNNYCYCFTHYKEVTEDEICENYRYWR